eukprot:3561698-Pyramimonas_sp.AAC.1
MSSAQQQKHDSGEGRASIKARTTGSTTNSKTMAISRARTPASMPLGRMTRHRNFKTGATLSGATVAFKTHHIHL